MTHLPSPQWFFVTDRRLTWVCLVLGAVLIGWVASPVQAQDTASDLPALDLEELMKLDVIPIDVMGSHIHLQGEWMLGYRFMTMNMGNAHHDADHIHFDGFMVQPTRMEMQMHMMELMYGLTRNLTLMAMLPYTRLSMSHATQSGGHFTTSSEGIGDLVAGAHYALYQKNNTFLISLLGVSIPTGSIHARDDTPAGPDQKLPYPMQLGSGTVGLHTGLTFLYQQKHWNWGLHADAQLGLGTNSNHYRPGPTYHAGAWATRRLQEWVSLTLHVDAHRKDEIHGRDPDLNPAMAPTANPHLLDETHVAVTPALDLYGPRGVLKGHRLSIRGEFPLYEAHGGVHLENHMRMMVGWQVTF